MNLSKQYWGSAGFGMDSSGIAKWWAVGAECPHCRQVQFLPPTYWPSKPGQNVDKKQRSHQWTAGELNIILNLFEVYNNLKTQLKLSITIEKSGNYDEKHVCCISPIFVNKYMLQLPNIVILRHSSWKC